MKIVFLIILISLFGCATKTQNNYLLEFPKTKKEILIIDIDNTIANASILKFIFSNYKEIPPLPNSVQVLNKLSKKYFIIYLTARHEVFQNHTFNWLKYNKFPDGPVYFWNISNLPFFPSEYKSFIISKLIKNKLKIAYAIGDRDSDIEAYSANRLKSFIIRKSKSLISTRKITFVKSWDEILNKINLSK